MSALGGTNPSAGAAPAGASGGASGDAGYGAGGDAGHSSGGAAQAMGGAPAGAGESSGGTAPITDGAAGEAGSMTVEPCVSSHPNALAFDGFDQGLTGEGFAPVMGVAAQTTSKGSTASVAWDPAVGRTCLGAFRVTGVFKGYGSSAEIAIGDVRFPSAHWSGAIALHAWVKVDPATAPLQGIQLFVVSGNAAQFFLGTFDSASFSYGLWYEMVVPLKAGGDYDPTTVSRVGLQIALKTAGSPGIPASPPTTSAWLEDVWVER
ncbi:MAG: hypothetical protein ABJB12_01985 [Pseudomonadota bacterium]